MSVIPATSGRIFHGWWAGLALASAARSLTEVYAAYGLGIGLGVGCSYVPVLGGVQRPPAVSFSAAWPTAWSAARPCS